MTTNVIDTSLHAAAFPPQYTGPGTLIGNAVNSGGVVERINGFFTSNGNATQINLGFNPMKIKIVNNTDGIVWEWQYGMPAANSVKTTLGGSLASVVDTSSQFTITGDQSPINVATLLLGTTLNGTAKSISYDIEG